MPEPQRAAIWFIDLAWVAWAATWFVLSLGVKPVVRRESLRSRLFHLVPLFLAAALLFDPNDAGRALSAPLVPRQGWMVFAGAALVALGFVFCIWARFAIGTNWSGTVTVKQDHTLIQNGPYALVRHPIYTGLLAAFLGTAIAIDAWRGVLAFVLVALSFLRKMRTEEQFMFETFGDEYKRYRLRTAALVPFVW